MLQLRPILLAHLLWVKFFFQKPPRKSRVQKREMCHHFYERARLSHWWLIQCHSSYRAGRHSLRVFWQSLKSKVCWFLHWSSGSEESGIVLELLKRRMTQHPLLSLILSTVSSVVLFGCCTGYLFCTSDYTSVSAGQNLGRAMMGGSGMGSLKGW